MIFAAPVPSCVAGSLADYQALGVTGCTAGLFTYKDFTFGPELTGDFSISDPLSKKATAESIFLTPPVGTFGAVGFFSTDFVVFGEDFATYRLHYVIDPPPPIIPGFDLDLFADSPVAPGTAYVFADLCIDKAPTITRRVARSEETPCRPYSLNVFDLGDSGKMFDAVVFDPPTNYIDVKLRIELKANGASSQIDGFRAEIATPEPAAFAMLGAGLGALVLLRRRRG